MQRLTGHEQEGDKLQAIAHDKEREIKDLHEKVAYLTKRTRDLEAKCLRQEDEIIDVRMMLLNQDAEYFQSLPKSVSRRPNTQLVPYKIACDVPTGDVDEGIASCDPLLTDSVLEKTSLSELEQQSDDEAFIVDALEESIISFGTSIGAPQSPVKVAAARMVCSLINKQDTAVLSTAFHHWAHSAKALKAISQQAQVAHLMAEQLETTKEKLARLKAHLRHSQKRSLEETRRGTRSGRRDGNTDD
jgi:hypothetical protein